MYTEKLNFIFGLPPDDIEADTNAVMRNSMPLAKIYPGIPVFQQGPELFHRGGLFETSSTPGIDSWERKKNKNSGAYHDILRDHKFELAQPEGALGKDGCVVVAFLADSFPTDSFTNEYGENFLQKFTNIASEGAASLAQMFGVKTIDEAFAKMAAPLTKDKESLMGAAVTGLTKGAKSARNFLSNVPILGGGIDTVSSLAAGGRLDFPMVWKGSGFQPSYTMTIRLYNPNPKSAIDTNKYIIGPIAALMLLAIPQSAGGSTYSWPFIHKIVSPGLFNLDPAFISNITIIKGGDQQQIAYGQQLGIVDVRIDFGSLYSSILAAKGLNRNRPTLKKYLEGMRSSKDLKKLTERKSKIKETRTEKLDEFDKSISFKEYGSKNQARTYVEPTQAEIDNPVNRVSEAKRLKAKFLRNKSPEGFVTRFW